MAARNDIVTAKLIAFPLAFIATGYGLCASQNTLPGIYALPASISTPLFAHVFYTGGQIIVPLGLISASASLYLAWSLPHRRNLWIAAAASTLLTLPWTRVIMYPGIQALIKISESATEQVRVEATQEHIPLLKTWELQNYIRASMFFIGGLTGWYATIFE